MPIPNERNDPRLVRRPDVVVPIARSATTATALQGRMMTPKKSPRRKASRTGLPLLGSEAPPVQRLRSISRMRMMENAARTRNAKGEMMERNLASETFTRVTNRMPNASMERMTPAATTIPNVSMECLRLLPLLLPVRNERNPGKSGMTHGDPRGA